MGGNIFGIALIHWLQILDALAWGIPLTVFMPAVSRVWRGCAAPIDVMVTPVVFIAINRIWASVAVLLYPDTSFAPNELPLRIAVHIFSILAVDGVMLAHRRAAEMPR